MDFTQSFLGLQGFSDHSQALKTSGTGRDMSRTSLTDPNGERNQRMDLYVSCVLIGYHGILTLILMRKVCYLVRSKTLKGLGKIHGRRNNLHE